MFSLIVATNFIFSIQWAVARSSRHPKYLVPILLYGPNNQFQGLLEAAVIARLVERTLVLPRNFSSWYRDGVSPKTIPFDDVFDSAFLGNFTPLKFVDKDIQELYTKKLPWTTITSPVPQSRLSAALSNIGFDSAPSKKMIVPGHLKSDMIRHYFAEPPLKLPSFVIMATFQSLAPTEEGLLVEAAHFRLRSERVRNLAKRLLQSIFSEDGHGFVMAVHVRRESTTLGCSSLRRYVACPLLNQTISTEEIVSRVVGVASDLGVHKIYLAHADGGPRAERQIILNALNRKGLIARSASGMPMDELVSFSIGPELTPFHQSLVEQEICASTQYFMPSALSTWSSTVAIDRKAHGLPVILPIENPFRMERAEPTLGKSETRKKTQKKNT